MILRECCINLILHFQNLIYNRTGFYRNNKKKMEEQLQGFEEEYPYDNNNNNTNNNGLLQPVIPGTNLPIQTEDVVTAREPENLPCSGPDIVEPTVPIVPLITTGLEEDPHSPHIPAPPSNYQTKVTDPTGEGGKEAEVDPLLERLDHFHVHDQSTPTVVDEVSCNKKPVTEIAAEMLGPVYGKVAGVGSAVLSKLRPGEDDKALSEAIFGKKEEEVIEVQPADEVAGKRISLQGVMGRLKSAVGSSSSWLGKSRSDVSAEHVVVEEEVNTMDGQTTSG